jgi:uncharacterized protein
MAKDGFSSCAWGSSRELTLAQAHPCCKRGHARHRFGLGYLLAARVSDAAVALAVGVISITFAARRPVIERQGAPVPTKPSAMAGWFWGAVCGFTSMIAHAGGPPFQVYVLAQRLARDVFVGTGAVLFAAINWIKLPPYVALGQFTHENLLTSAALFPLAVLATWLGVLLVRHVSEPV